MKKTNIIYWTVTGIFGAFMMSSAIPNIIVTPDWEEMVSNQMGYPTYIIPFLGVAKALGVIAILVPGLPKLKEWAYAGFFFDLLGATYSSIAIGGFEPGILFMVLPFSFLFVSYAYNQKRENAKEEVTQSARIAVSA
jgi:hypothetical protein